MPALKLIAASGEQGMQTQKNMSRVFRVLSLFSLHFIL